MKKRVKVCAALIMDNGKVLITRRAPSERQAGGWEFPGGKMKEGETPEECVIREIKEELSIDIIVKSFCTNVKHDYEEFHLDMDVYYCEIKKGIIDMSVHDQYAWVSVIDLLSFELLPADIKVANIIMKPYVKKNKKNGG